MFNTLKYAKMMEEVGFSREQSETSIKILVEIMEDKLVTKADIQEFRAETRQEFQSVRRDMQEFKQEFTHSLARLESKMTIRLGTMMAASMAILTAIVKLI